MKIFLPFRGKDRLPGGFCNPLLNFDEVWRLFVLPDFQKPMLYIRYNPALFELAVRTNHELSEMYYKVRDERPGTTLMYPGSAGVPEESEDFGKLRRTQPDQRKHLGRDGPRAHVSAQFARLEPVFSETPLDRLVNQT